MNTRQLIVGALLLALLVFIAWGREAHGREVTIRDGDGNEQSWDLTQMAQRAEFRALYGKTAGVCLSRADYAAKLMDERDGGKSESAHLAEVKAHYEKTRHDPEGAVAHHIYVDFQRMVRDIHRVDSSGYVWKDRWGVWEREVWWCILPGRRIADGF